jgi:uncharacterized membrane protein YphA (DoxX/SURF4 family)
LIIILYGEKMQLFDNVRELIRNYGEAASFLVVRIGLSIVFLYFGISQLRNPEAFIGWLPKEVSLLPFEPRTFVVLNGGFETFFGTLLLIGLYTRIAALLLGMHLLGITFTIGWTEIGVRDLGLALATISISLWPRLPCSMDQKISLGKGVDTAVKTK